MPSFNELEREHCKRNNWPQPIVKSFGVLSRPEESHQDPIVPTPNTPSL
jgi:hypothetical protein